MNKDVLVTIKGLQNLENTGDPEEVELVARTYQEYYQDHREKCGGKEKRSHQCPDDL